MAALHHDKPGAKPPNMNNNLSLPATTETKDVHFWRTPKATGYKKKSPMFFFPSPRAVSELMVHFFPAPYFKQSFSHSPKLSTHFFLHESLQETKRKNQNTHVTPDLLTSKIL